jgi:hypothetical protein
MLDSAKLWKRGVRAVAVTFDTFLVAAQDQAKAMAMPDIPIVVIPHIKAGEKPEDFRGRAEEALAEIAAHLELDGPQLQPAASRVIESGREERVVHAET